jgi:hypothetical protein
MSERPLTIVSLNVRRLGKDSAKQKLIKTWLTSFQNPPQILRNAKRRQHTPSIISFVQSLNLRNSTVAQIIAKIWHNARPRKVGALTSLTLNKGLPVGTWL